MATDAWGIDARYEDARGAWQQTSDATRQAILAAMGIDAQAGALERPDTPVVVLDAGATRALDVAADLVLEDGTDLGHRTSLPPDLPPGYHKLRPHDGRPAIRLIVSPGRCYLPAGLRGWGWAVQLYATRSAASWGFGDLADLRRLARWSSADLGAWMLLVNPLHAPLPTVPQQPSPYYPSSRLYRNALYLRIEEVPGAQQLGGELARLAAAGRALNAQRVIDRDAVFRLKMDALERIWASFGADLAFDSYCNEQGPALERFATFNALVEQHGGGWRAWPAEHRRPDAPGVAAFARDRADRVRFHQWLQWLVDTQLAAAAGEAMLMQDLPIGVDPAGADAWAWQDVLATDVAVGAPPDVFNPDGQNWGLPPFVPHKLRAAGYEPFIQTVRASLRHAGGLRVDHVMGIFRLFWIPHGFDAASGAYVRYHADELLAILALESHRARAVIIGEDLGTVERGVREEMAQRQMLSYRLLWFEDTFPSGYPKAAMAAVTTHDLPTIAGVWSGADLQARRDLGLSPDERSFDELRERLEAITGLSPRAELDDVIVATHRQIARAPSMLVTATLEDALAVPERPNQPGSTACTNWSLALPQPLEAIEHDPRVRAVAAALRRPGATEQGTAAG